MAALRVLVAEDSLVNQMIAQLMLAKLGHEVTTVRDGVAAVEAVHHGGFHVVLMDTQLPVLDGLGAAAQIRAELPPERQPRIVAVSASVLPEDRSSSAAAGMDEFLSKPLRLHELDALLQRAGPLPPRQASDTRIEGIRDRLDELAGHDLDEDRILFSQMLRSLAGRAPAALDDIESAARQNDSAAVTEQAHGLKGSVSNLGGDALAGMLDEIEQRSHLGQPTSLATLERVRHELTLCCGALLAVADTLDQGTTRVGAVGQPQV